MRVLAACVLLLAACSDVGGDVDVVDSNVEAGLVVASGASVTVDEDGAVEFDLQGSGDTALVFKITTFPPGPANLVQLVADGPRVRFTPGLNQTGSSSFQFTVQDSDELSAPATVDVTITPVNDAPLADNQNLGAVEDTPLSITLSGSDVDGDALAYRVASGPSIGVLSGSGAPRT
jgi:hypothetical protein